MEHQKTAGQTIVRRAIVRTLMLVQVTLQWMMLVQEIPYRAIVLKTSIQAKDIGGIDRRICISTKNDYNVHINVCLYFMLILDVYQSLEPCCCQLRKQERAKGYMIGKISSIWHNAHQEASASTDHNYKISFYIFLYDMAPASRGTKNILPFMNIEDLRGAILTVYSLSHNI